MFSRTCRAEVRRRRITFHVSRLWRAEFCSPKDFVRRALFISFAFLILHLAGLKEFTTILNGTMGSVELGWGMSAFLGLVYVCAWLGFVVLAPILLLAAVLLTIWNRISRAVDVNASASERTSPPRASLGEPIERHLVARAALKKHARGGLVRSDTVVGGL